MALNRAGSSRSMAPARTSHRPPWAREPSKLAVYLHGHPTPQLAQLALIHGYTTVFWWCAGIFAAGAIICGALLRPGPLTGPEDIPARKPSLQAAPARS